MKTVADFVEACKSLSPDEIYEMFYDASDELRDAVYAEGERLGVVLLNTPEPARATMSALGTHYNVQALVDY